MVICMACGHHVNLNLIKRYTVFLKGRCMDNEMYCFDMNLCKLRGKIGHTNVKTLVFLGSRALALCKLECVRIVLCRQIPPISQRETPDVGFTLCTHIGNRTWTFDVTSKRL